MEVNIPSQLTNTSGTYIDASPSANTIATNCSPYSTLGFHYNPPYYSCPCRKDDLRMGEFDIHLDRTGVLRIMHNGKVVSELKPKAGK